MQNKRLRGNRGVPPERTTRVRRRLVAGVAVVGLAVLAASAPSVYSASAELTDAQRLVTLSDLDQQTVSLAHDLADERDDVTVYIAGGRAKKDKLAADRATRVDSDIEEIGASAPADLRHDLATLPSVRRTALTDKSSALEANKAYSDLIEKVQETSGQLADRTPPEDAAATRAAADLGHAVGEASQTRGLLLGALAVPRPVTTSVYDPVTGTYVQKSADTGGADGRTRDALSAAAQQARVRELAALADFDQAADPADQESLASTVSGPEVSTAEGYLSRLADQPTLSAADLKTNPAKAGAALAARTDQMRGVEASLATRQAKRIAALRDDAVTALELRIALAGFLLLLTIGVGAAVARTLTRPLAVLRIGAARLAGAPESEEPIVFTGRNDEFAQVVRSINALHTRVLTADARAEALARDQRDLRGGRDRFDAERAMLEADTAEVTARLDRLHHTVRATFVNLSLRSSAWSSVSSPSSRAWRSANRTPRRSPPSSSSTTWRPCCAATARTCWFSRAPSTATDRARGRYPWWTCCVPRSVRSSGTNASPSSPCRRTPRSRASPPTTSATSWPSCWRTPPRSRRRKPMSSSPAGSWRAAR